MSPPPKNKAVTRTAETKSVPDNDRQIRAIINQGVKPKKGSETSSDVTKAFTIQLSEKTLEDINDIRKLYPFVPGRKIRISLQAWLQKAIEAQLTKDKKEFCI